LDFKSNIHTFGVSIYAYSEVLTAYIVQHILLFAIPEPSMKEIRNGKYKRVGNHLKTVADLGDME